MRAFLCILLTAVLLCGCAAPQSEPKAAADAVTFTDDLGREVRVANPERVACLIGSFADIWHLAGGTDTIVAAANDTWRYFDIPLDETVVDLGATKALDLEQLIACQPDLILASGNTAGNVALEPTFRQAGLNAAYFSVSTFADYLRMLKICTQITGCPEKYEENGARVQKAVDAAIARADGSQPSVLYIRASGSSCKVKSSNGSVLGEMLRDLDCRNIADTDARPLEQLSMEAILEADPEYIFVVLQSADPEAAKTVLETTLLAHPAWETLTAVKEGRLHLMDPTLYNLKPNERWGEAYEGLADILYP